MRKNIVAANWKMNMTISEAEGFLEDFRLDVEDVTGVEIVIAPPFTALPKLSELLGGSQKIRLGAQNFYYEKSGAYTGEVSATMLRELFVRYVIIGHSERRQIFGETDDLINKKVKVALASELRPILCVGETLAEREAGKEKSVLETQLRGGLAGVTAQDLLETVIAYEPVWAIGTGLTPTLEQIEEVHRAVRAAMIERLGLGVAATPILYGGSVKPDNAREILAAQEVGGALVGGASLKAADFLGIIRGA